MGWMISSLYLTAVTSPSTTICCDFTSCAVPPHTITEQPQTYTVRQRSAPRDVGVHEPSHLFASWLLCFVMFVNILYFFSLLSVPEGAGRH